MDYRTIHKIVQGLCVADYGWDMEVYVKSPLGVGFLDLYDYKNNQYYEVKSERAGQTVNTANQMLKYDTSIISAKRYQDKNILTPPTRGTTLVSGSFAYGLYDVTYKLNSAGLITYRCDLNSNRTLALAIALVGVLCVATGNLPGAAGAGAFIPALV